jgi:hypothetical protein
MISTEKFPFSVASGQSNALQHWSWFSVLISQLVHASMMTVLSLGVDEIPVHVLRCIFLSSQLDAVLRCANNKMLNTIKTHEKMRLRDFFASCDSSGGMQCISTW